jgi:hypothetical protein
MKRTDGTNSIEKYTQPITVQSSNSAALSKLTIMDQIPIAEDSSLSVKMLTPVHGQDNPPVIEDSNEPSDSISAQTGDSPINTAWGVGKRIECSSFSADTGVVTWEFSEANVAHVTLEWEVTNSTNKTVQSHFDDDI